MSSKMVKTKSRQKFGPKPKPKPKRVKKMQPRRAGGRLKSAHAYLDPFFSRGHVVTHQMHAPYIVIESARKWTANLSANDNMLIYVTWTNTICRGSAYIWNGPADASGYNILSTQLQNVTPTHVATQRLGIEVQNVTSPLYIGGLIYVLTTNDPVAITPMADNTGDNYTRITNAEAARLASKVTNSAHTRVVSAQSTTNRKLKALNVITNPDLLWETFQAVTDNNLANTVYEAALGTADIMNHLSSTLIYIPGQANAQVYSFDMRSHDGCRFDTDHPLFGSATHAPLVSNTVVANLYTQAHRQAKLGEKAPIAAAPHESFMSKVGHFIGDVEGVAKAVGKAVPRIGEAIYNTIGTSRALRSVFSSPMVEEVAEAAPLLLGV